MFKRLFITALAAATLVSIGYAQEPAGKITIPVNKTTASNGKLMYSNYCAPCHGVNGRGEGPVASELKVPPTDLSMLAKDNNGKYPAMHVIAVLRFGAETGFAHGSAQMPVWGPILGGMDHTMGSPDAQTLRITNLARYVETLQVK